MRSSSPAKPVPLRTAKPTLELYSSATIHPGHLFEGRRHHVVRAGRPTLPQSLLKQGRAARRVAMVGLYLAGEQHGLEHSDANPMRTEQLQGLGQKLVARSKSPRMAAARARLLSE